MSSGPANVVMDRGPARPAAARQRVDVSEDDKRLLEAASRTPAVLDAFNIPWKWVAAAVKPVSAKAADIGAAALGKLLGTVTYVGLPHNEQVDTTQFRVPDRTPGPASPPLVQLPRGLRAAVNGVVEHAAAMAQQASRAIEQGLDAARAGEEALQAAQAATQAADAATQGQVLSVQRVHTLEQEASAQALLLEQGVLEVGQLRAKTQAQAQELEVLRAEAKAQEAKAQSQAQHTHEQLMQHRAVATAATLLVHELRTQQSADATAAKFVAGAATAEAQSAQRAREEQRYESKKESQQLERRDEALKKAMAALESATVRARVRARGACPYHTNDVCACVVRGRCVMIALHNMLVRVAPACSRAGACPFVRRVVGTCPPARHVCARRLPSYTSCPASPCVLCLLRLCLVALCL